MSGGFVVVWHCLTPPFVGYGHLPLPLPHDDAVHLALGLQELGALADCRVIPEEQFATWKEQVQ